MSKKPEVSWIAIKVAPKSSQNRVALLGSGELKVWVNSPPVDGAANEAVIEILAKFLAIPKSRFQIVSGSSSRNKRISVADIGQVALDQAIVTKIPHG